MEHIRWTCKNRGGTLIPYEHQYLRRSHQDLRRRFDEAIFGEYERRVILSMTYCADPRISRFKEFVRRCKDTAFFGLRALWD